VVLEGGEVFLEFGGEVGGGVEEGVNGAFNDGPAFGVKVLEAFAEFVEAGLGFGVEGGLGVFEGEEEGEEVDFGFVGFHVGGCGDGGFWVSVALL